MGRFARAALKPMYELIEEGDGGFLRVMRSCLLPWEAIPPNIVPRQALCSNQMNPLNPVRIYLDSAGEGGPASLAILSIPERPTLVFLYGGAQEKMHSPAAITSEIYVFGLCASCGAEEFRILWGTKQLLQLFRGAQPKKR